LLLVYSHHDGDESDLITITITSGAGTTFKGVITAIYQILPSVSFDKQKGTLTSFIAFKNEFILKLFTVCA